MGLLDALAPDERQQMGYGLLSQLGSALMAAGSPSAQGQRGAILGQGFGRASMYPQAYARDALLGRMTQMQLAEMQRKQEQEEATRQAQSRLTARLTGAPNMARNPQVASADGVPSMGAPNLAGLAQDPSGLADLIAATGGNPLPVMQMLQKEDKETVVGPGAALVRGGKAIFTNPRSDRPTELDKLFEAAGIPEGDPMRAQLAKQILERKGQPMSVKVDNIGNIPPGYELVTTPEGAKRMQLIPGSPAAEAKGKQEQRQEQTGSVVVQDIDRAIGIINDKSTMLPTTGFAGNILSKIGGTAANDVRALLDSVKANAGFKELQAMRDSSPTGGALGSITERELALLQATIGSLEQSQTKDQLLDNMRRVKNVYLDIIHGPGNGPKRETLKFQDPKADDDGWTDLGNGVRIRRKP